MYLNLPITATTLLLGHCFATQALAQTMIARTSEGLAPTAITPSLAQFECLRVGRHIAAEEQYGPFQRRL